VLFERGLSFLNSKKASKHKVFCEVLHNEFNLRLLAISQIGLRSACCSMGFAVVFHSFGVIVVEAGVLQINQVQGA